MVWIRCRNYLPAKTNELAASKFLTYFYDLSMRNMNKWTDQMIFIMDIYDIGYSNFDIKQAGKMVPIISVNLIYKIINCYRATMLKL